LTERKKRLLAELLPQLRLALDRPSPPSPTTLFPVPVREVWLEIGFGAGEHLIWQAEHHTHIGFIGCEPFINGVGSLLGAIQDRGLKTIHIHDGDAREVLAWLPDASIGRVFLLFPDPWPKTRHLKRRLLGLETATELARVLRRGGEFRFASDDGDYVAQALSTLQAGGRFDWLAEGPSDWRARPQDWPETRYERKALREGHRAAYLRFRRR
jgi:tRNA (guanine-N7-)-methyltransferase